jgi:hypothetical protein
LDQELQQRWRAQLAYFAMTLMPSMTLQLKRFLALTSPISIANTYSRCHEPFALG